MQRFKPGVDSIVLLFSDQDGRSVYQFPYYQLFEPVLLPLLEEVRRPGEASFPCHSYKCTFSTDGCCCRYCLLAPFIAGVAAEQVRFLLVAVLRPQAEVLPSLPSPPC